MKHDPVNHPRHYTSHPSGVECIDVVRHFTFNVGNVIKYCWRAGLKQSATQTQLQKHLEDLKKAKWYIEDEIKLIERELQNADQKELDLAQNAAGVSKSEFTRQIDPCAYCGRTDHTDDECKQRVDHANFAHGGKAIHA